MNTKEIDQEIKRLETLKRISNATTADGEPIEVGKIYYTISSISQGIEEIVLDENRVNYYNYSVLSSTREHAKNRRIRFLENTISNLQHSVLAAQISLEKVKELK